MEESRLEVSEEAETPRDVMDYSVEVRGLWKVFGPRSNEVMDGDLRRASKDEILEKAGCVLALRDISFQVERGEFFVLMGLSGSGKSTLIRCLLRLIEPTVGKVFINGEDICSYNKARLMHLRRHTVSMVFQHFGLLPHCTVIDNVAYGLKIRGMPKKERYERAQEAIETVGLKGWEHYLPNSLSGGMQQRVGLARALATDPQILLMDEPFSGLDPLIRRQMQDELVELQDRLRKTVIFVTHDLYEALKLGCRIAIMRDGEIIQLGTPEEIITDPADDYVREFVQDASPAKVLTAGKIMEEPELLLYEWQGPKAAHHMLRSSKQDHAFVVSKSRQLVGIVTRERIRETIERGASSLRDAMDEEPPTCTPDMLVEELFPIASSTPYPIAVLDENGRFLGVIHNRTILDSMIQDREEKTDV
jgi:glycine betaine/proline transport system ATP-binding protein